MSTTTTNYNFVKPELSDPADITAQNENWNKIDSELGRLGGTLICKGRRVVENPFGYAYFIAIEGDTDYLHRSHIFTVYECNYDTLMVNARCVDSGFNGHAINTHSLRFYWGDGYQCDFTSKYFDVDSGDESTGTDQWDYVIGFKMSDLVLNK